MTAVTGSNRVKRGGSWNNNARNCRAPNRNNDNPGNRNNNLGFRLASALQRPRARFTDRARVLGPCPGGSSRAGECRTNSKRLRRLVGPIGARRPSQASQHESR